MSYFIYGATSSGVAGACTAADLGVDVFLVDPGNRIGYMWSGGLAQTDRENTFAATSTTSLRWGFLLEFTKSLADYAGLNTGSTRNELLLASTPAVFNVLTAKLNLYSSRKTVSGKTTGKITVVPNAVLTAVNKKGDVIISVVCGGTTYTCLNYTDCTDEGDLCKMAGVPMRIARESVAHANEPTAGVRPQVSSGALAYDPNTGDRIATLDSRPYQNLGEADGHTMAFNMRIPVCTHVDRIQWANITVPNFDPREHDLDLSIAVAKGYTSIPGSISNNPLRPTVTYEELDMNNGGLLQIGSNWIGKFLGWPTMSYADRMTLKNAYIRRTASLFKTICTDAAWAAALPALVADTKLYGLIPGYFTDSYIPGFPSHIYVRESYRAVGKEDMTFADIIAPEHNVTEPITAYGYPYADGHWAGRYAGADGTVVFEGGAGLDGGKEIVATFMKWGAVQARNGDARNLTFVRCASGTRMGWVILRIEMSYMKVAQAVAIAAAVADTKDGYTGDLNYTKDIKPALVAGGAIISLPVGSS